MTNEAIGDDRKGVIVFEHKIETINFADDQAWFSRSAKTLKKLVSKVHFTTKKYNIKINIDVKKITTMAIAIQFKRRNISWLFYDISGELFLLHRLNNHRWHELQKVN